MGDDATAGRRGGGRSSTPVVPSYRGAPAVSRLTSYAFCLFATSASAQSIQDMLAVQFHSDLTAAPNGEAVAWITNDRGSRNIFIARAPSYQPVQVTRFSGDDGQPLSQLTWSRDGRALYFVRGGAPGSNWDVDAPVRPLSGMAAEPQSVWQASLTGGLTRRIGEGHSPAAAGGRLIWLRNDTLRTQTGALHVRGAQGAAVFASDNRRFAFVSNRGDHAIIGVHDGASLTWLAPGSWRDSHPRWSADGTRIAFIRRAGAPFQQGLPLPSLRDSTLGPFLIMVAEVARPESARVVYRSPVGPDGSLPGLGGEWSLQWGAGDTLLFASELTGWLGLYRTTAAGGGVERLTPTGCEIRDVMLSADRGSIYYASNCGDIDRLHIQRVAVSGGAPVSVTSGSGIEWSPKLLADGRVFAMRSSAHCPVQPGLVEAPLTCGLTLIEPRQVVVRAADSTPIHLQVLDPPVSCNLQSPCPAVLFFHGGPQRQMLLGWHDRGYYHNAYALNQYLARRGFIVVSVNYRGGIGYGRAFREAPRRGRNGASEYQDVLAAAEWLRQRGATRIGLWGGSYGGYLTALGLARNSDLFAAGFDLHGVHDYAVNRQGQTVGNDSAVAIARRASPVSDVANWRSPILLVAGDDDRNVEFQQTTDLAVRLRRLGVPVEELMFPDDVHSFLRHANWVRAFEAGAGFLERHLMR